MPLVPIHNVGSVGIVKDIPPHELPPEAWSAGQNVRFKDNKVLKIQGDSAALGSPTVVPYWMLPVPAGSSYFWLYAGLLKVYVTDGTTHTDITRAAGDYGATALNRWNGGVLSGIPVINNGVNEPQMWNPTTIGTDLILLDNWTATDLCDIIRPFKQHLVALGITTGGNKYPYRVWWSHPADPGAVPTSWDISDATKDAGITELAETSDILVDGLALGNSFIIYKENTTWSMQFIGGAFVFRFNKIFGEFGMLSRDCTREFFGKHFVVTDNDIVIHNGQSVESLLSRKQRAAFFSSLDVTNYTRTFVMINPAEKEIWVCYPTSGNTNPNEALIWNWEGNTWGHRELNGVTFGWPGVVNPGTSGIWDDDSEVWNDDNTVWDERLYSPTSSGILLADPAGSGALLQGDSTNQFQGSSMTSYVERTGLAVAGTDRAGNPKVDVSRFKLLTRVWINMTSTGPITVRVGGQDRHDGAVTWKTGITFDPSTQSYIDCLVNTKFMALRFESDTDISWELHSYKLDVKPGGMF